MARREETEEKEKCEPFSHLFTELKISPIEVHIISAIQLEISPIQLKISPNQLETSTNIPI